MIGGLPRTMIFGLTRRNLGKLPQSASAPAAPSRDVTASRLDAIRTGPTSPVFCSWSEEAICKSRFERLDWQRPNFVNNPFPTKHYT
jgi:hypothetical protein